MTVLATPLLLLWIGVRINMPIVYYIVISVLVVIDLAIAAYNAGRNK